MRLLLTSYSKTWTGLQAQFGKHPEKRTGQSHCQSRCGCDMMQHTCQHAECRIKISDIQLRLLQHEEPSFTKACEETKVVRCHSYVLMVNERSHHRWSRMSPGMQLCNCSCLPGHFKVGEWLWIKMYPGLQALCTPITPLESKQVLHPDLNADLTGALRRAHLASC